MYVIHNSYSMNCIENGTYGANSSSTETHKNFIYTDTLRPMWGGELFKRILTHLCFTMHKEINMYHFDAQMHNFYKNDINTISILNTGSHKSFPILWEGN